MSIERMFVDKKRAESFLSARDTATHRVCGTCNSLLPNSEFYKDGFDKEGSPKYRRDCKSCYKQTRTTEYLYKKGIK